MKKTNYLITYQGLTFDIESGERSTIGEGSLLLSFDAEFDSRIKDLRETIYVKRNDDMVITYSLPVAVLSDLRATGVHGIIPGTAPFERLDVGFSIYFLAMKNATAVVLDGGQGPLLARILEDVDNIEDVVRQAVELASGDIGNVTLFADDRNPARSDLLKIIEASDDDDAPLNGWVFEKHPIADFIHSIQAVKRNDWFLDAKERLDMEVSAQRKRSINFVAIGTIFALAGFGTYMYGTKSLASALNELQMKTTRVSKLTDKLNLESNRRIVGNIIAAQNKVLDVFQNLEDGPKLERMHVTLAGNASFSLLQKGYIGAQRDLQHSLIVSSGELRSIERMTIGVK